MSERFKEKRYPCGAERVVLRSRFSSPWESPRGSPRGLLGKASRGRDGDVSRRVLAEGLRSPSARRNGIILTALRGAERLPPGERADGLRACRSAAGGDGWDAAAGCAWRRAKERRTAPAIPPGLQLGLTALPAAQDGDWVVSKVPSTLSRPVML